MMMLGGTLLTMALGLAALGAHGQQQPDLVWPRSFLANFTGAFETRSAPCSQLHKAGYAGNHVV